MTINLDEIEKALGERTQGKWTHGWNEGENSDGFVENDEGKMIAIVAGGNYLRWEDKPDGGESEFKANGDLIAHAPEWLRLLVERVRKLEKVAEAARVVAQQNGEEGICDLDDALSLLDKEST